MSEQELIAELPSADFCPEEEAPPVDVRTDMDELKDIFSNCTSKQEALMLMHKNKTEIDGSKKFSYNGKNYGFSNARKAINKLDEQNQFKTKSSQKIELKDATYKMEAPQLPPQPEPQPEPTPQNTEQPDSPQTDQQPNWQYGQQDQPQQQSQQPTQVVVDEQAKKEAVDFLTRSIESFFNNRAESFKDSDPKKAKTWAISHSDAELFALALNKRFGGNKGYIAETDMLLIVSIVAPRVLCEVPQQFKDKIMNKIFGLSQGAQA